MGGCLGGDGSPPATSCGTGTPAIQIWSGLDLDVFAPLHDGDRVYVRCGGQGLRHVRFRVRAAGLAVRFHMSARLRDRSSALVAETPASAPESTFRDAGGVCESPDHLLIVGPPSRDIADEPADLYVRVADADGREVTARVAVVIDTDHMGCET